MILLFVFLRLILFFVKQELLLFSSDNEASSSVNESRTDDEIQSNFSKFDFQAVEINSGANNDNTDDNIEYDNRFKMDDDNYYQEDDDIIEYHPKDDNINECRQEDDNINDGNNDDNDTDNNEQNDIFYQQPIYEGAPISIQDSMLLMLNLALKHNLPDTCISDIFNVINKHCLPKNFKKMSLYHFRKFFQFENQTVTKNYYCSDCHKLIDPTGNVCDGCRRQSEIKYFLTLSIIDQLKLVINKKNMIDLLNKNFTREKDDSYIAELYDGNVYKSENVQMFLSCANNITLSWCTDGVPVFKSSKIGIWPFYLRINELPYSIRTIRENTILAGVFLRKLVNLRNKRLYVTDLHSIYL